MKSMKNLNILISGASLAGPALAYWLNRYGFHPTVVERTPEFRKGGYKLDIRGAAVEVVERMGILADIRQASTNMKGATFVNRNNKPVASMPAAFLNLREGRDDEIMRTDLACILYEQTRSTVEYIFGDSITSITQGEKGVMVTFERDEPRIFDLVVGADGLHSKVRQLTFGDESRFIRPLEAYISIFTTPNFLHLDHWELHHYAGPGKLVSLFSSRDSSKAMSMFFFSSLPLDYDYHNSEQQKKLLATAFSGGGWQIPRLLKEVRGAPDFYFDSISQIHMDHWSVGRIALLGDAAYCASPASGQGTSLALVGAYVLAGELAVASGDYPTAFARYEYEMRRYVAANQKLAESINDIVPQTQTGLWFRTQTLRVLPHLPLKDLVASKLTQKVQLAASSITLKDYES